MGGTKRALGAASPSFGRASAVVRYGAVVVVAVVAFALGEAATPGWYLNFSFVPFYLALVVVGAWIGGFWPGVLSTIACTLTAMCFWDAPVYSFAVETWSEAVSILLFFSLGV